MKALLSLLLLAFGSVLSARGSTNLLSVHFVDGPFITAQLLTADLTVANASPLSAPILTDHDFTAYDVTNHVFAIKSEAARRLAYVLNGPPRDGLYNLSGGGTPFVLCVSGEPIYVGVFSSNTSSIDYPYPTMLPQESFFDARTSTNLTFMIRRQPVQRSSDVAYLRSSVLDTDPPSDVKDVRNDPRILDAIKKLKLNQ